MFQIFDGRSNFMVTCLITTEIKLRKRGGSFSMDGACEIVSFERLSLDRNVLFGYKRSKTRC